MQTYLSFLDLSQPTYCETFIVTRPSSGKNLARLGNPSDCFVSVGFNTSLKLTLNSLLYLDSDPFVVGSPITLIPNATRNYLDYYSTGSSGRVTLLMPVQTFLPDISISGPSIVGTCSPLILGVNINSGSAGRSWTASSYTFTSQLFDQSDTALSAFLQQQVSMSPISQTISIDTTQMVARNYTFSFSFTNWLGVSSVQSIQVQKIASSDIPVVSIAALGSSVSVSLPNNVVATVSKVCGLSLVVQFLWSCAALNIQSKNVNSQYTIPPYTLQPSTTYTVSVSVNLVGKQAYVFSTSFTTQPEVLTISSGTSGIIGILDTVSLYPMLKSTSTLSPTLNAYTCTWTCSLGSGLRCQSFAGIIFVGGTSCSSQIIKPNTLASSLSGQQYQFQLIGKRN